MTSQLDIYNLALSALGSQGVADVDEASREGDLCRLHFTHTRNLILSAAPWPAVRKHRRLAALSSAESSWDSDGPAPGYSNAFSAPSDLQHPYHLQSYGRFEYSLGPSGPQISCNETAPILYYNAQNTTVADWDLHLVDAMIHGLAMAMAMELTGSSQKLRDQYDLTQMRIAEARAATMRAQMEKEETLPDWFVARGVSNYSQARYTYPFAELRYPGVA